MPNFYEGELEGSDISVAVVVSRFNEEICGRLLDGCVDELVRLGVSDSDIDVLWVPGAFELPQVAAQCLDEDGYDAVVCLGCVIRGETAHFEYVANAAASGIAELARGSETPVLFGVLTTEDRAQAEARSGGAKGNHGEYVARAAVEMVRLLEQIGDDENDASDEDEFDAELETEGVEE